MTAVPPRQRAISRGRRLVGRVPLAGWICAAAALLSGLSWSLMTPPFQVPDEISHFAYAQYLAETGDPPRHVAGDYMSEEQRRTLEALRFFAVIGQRGHRTVWTEERQRQLDSVLAADLDRVSDGSSSTAVNNPPLFYALQAVPYRVASGGTILDRLAAMRVLSVVLAALTVLCVFMFLREAFPGTPWAWTVGALVVAFQPLFGFIASGVNNDAGLFLAAAAFFFVLARCFRRGLTAPRAAALGAVVGLGVVTKLTFVALVPAFLAAIAVLSWRSPRARRREAMVAAGVGTAVAAAPVALYIGLNELAWSRDVYGSLAGSEAEAGGDGRPGSLRELLSYLWQLYLPRLPFQADLIGGEAFRHLWLNGLIGRFGWLDYGFRPWVYDLGLGVAVAVGALAAIGAIRLRHALRARWLELAVYGLATAGLLLLVGRAGYSAFVGAQPPFEQARYLLPLLPLYAAVVVLAARAGGIRWGPALGAAMVVVAIGHTVFSQLLTLARYYG